MYSRREYCKIKKGCINMAIMTKPNKLAFRVDEKKKDMFLRQSVSKSQEKQMRKSAKQIENQLKRSK